MSLLSEPLGTVHGDAIVMVQTKIGTIAVRRRTRDMITRNSWGGAPIAVLRPFGAVDQRRTALAPKSLSVTAKGVDGHKPRRAARWKTTRAFETCREKQ